MNASPRFADVKSTVEGGYPEIQIRFDQERAAALGLTTKQISDQIVNKVRGSVATRYNFRDRKIDVLVRAQADQRAFGRRYPQSDRWLSGDRKRGNDRRLEFVGKLAVRAIRHPPPVAIRRLRRARAIRETALPTTLRHRFVCRPLPTSFRRGPERNPPHRPGARRHRVGESALRRSWHRGRRSAQLIRDNPLAAGVTAHIGGQSEELDASVKSLIFALALAIFLVYLVMASQFESLLHPFVIMFSIPLALVGAVLALKLTFTPLSVVVFIGLIMLAGIVVKNAIVLIDRVNQLREEGVDKLDAIAQAAESRLRPITMTTLCTLLGFMPLAIGCRRRFTRCARRWRSR